MNTYFAHAGHVHADEMTSPLDSETLFITIGVLVVVVGLIIALALYDQKKRAHSKVSSKPPEDK